MSSVTISGISKSYGAHNVLDAVDLHIPNGSITSVLGASGCGKTTLLRIIAGFVRADAGSVSLGERVVVGSTFVPPQKRGVGYVPQEGALFPHLDIASNILFGLPRAARSTKRLDEMLELAELPSEVVRRYPHELSGGQQQRVALARALAPSPTVVLLDEPFSSLDATLRVSAGRTVARVLRHAGATAVVVTHDQGEALSLADQVALMRDGRFVQVSAPNIVYDEPVDPEAAEFVGGGSVIEAIVSPGGVAHTAVGALTVSPSEPGPAQLLVRPEQVELVPVGEGAHAVVDEVTYYGAQVVVRLQLAEGLVLTARGPAARPPTAGDQVGVVVRGVVRGYPAARP